MAKLKTLHIPIYGPGARVRHVATIRSDWDRVDYADLIKRFPGCYLRSASLRTPLHMIGMKQHYTDFAHLGKYAQK